VDKIEKEVAAGGPAANAAKRRVAREIVTLYHGADSARTAEARFDAVIRDRAVDDDAQPYALPHESPVHLPALLVEAGLAESTSAARRLIDSGAVRLDGARLEPGRYDVERAALRGAVLAVGKKQRSVRLTEG
jgi:tyrosyl-tRNA synthetase